MIRTVITDTLHPDMKEVRLHDGGISTHRLDGDFYGSLLIGRTL